MYKQQHVISASLSCGAGAQSVCLMLLLYSRVLVCTTLSAPLQFKAPSQKTVCALSSTYTLCSCQAVSFVTGWQALPSSSLHEVLQQTMSSAGLMLKSSLLHDVTQGHSAPLEQHYLCRTQRLTVKRVCSVLQAVSASFRVQLSKPCAIMQANVPQEEVLDPAEAKRRAIEAEEARLAAQRAHGTQVTPETFVDWQKRFDAEQALQKARWPTPSFCMCVCVDSCHSVHCCGQCMRAWM